MKKLATTRLHSTTTPQEIVPIMNDNLSRIEDNVNVPKDIQATSIQIEGTKELDVDTTGDLLQVGPTSDMNIAIDQDDIQARSHGLPATLYLNYYGGDVNIADDGGTTILGGDLHLDGDIELGNTSDTTIARSSAGKATLEGDGIVTARVLFNSTAAREVTISSAYTNFNQLVILYYWVDTYGTITLDCATGTHKFAVIRAGLIDSVYKIQVGAATITLSSTTVTGSTTGNTYTMQTTSASVHSFSDAIGELKIARVTGLKW